MLQLPVMNEKIFQFVDICRFSGTFHHLDLPSGLNGSVERDWIDHGDYTPPDLADDYVAVKGQGHDHYYYFSYGRRHRVHAAYMDDYFGGSGYMVPLPSPLLSHLHTCLYMNFLCLILSPLKIMIMMI